MPANLDGFGIAAIIRRGALPLPRPSVSTDVGIMDEMGVVGAGAMVGVGVDGEVGCGFVVVGVIEGLDLSI